MFQAVTLSIRQSASLSICEFVNPSIRQPPSLSTCPCDNLSRCPPVNLRIRDPTTSCSVKASNLESAKRSIRQCLRLSISHLTISPPLSFQSPRPSICQPVNPSIRRYDKPSFCQFVTLPYFQNADQSLRQAGAPSICLPVHQFVRKFVYLCPSTCQSVVPSVCRSVNLSICQLVEASARQTPHLSICPSPIRQNARLSICPPADTSICPPVILRI